MRTIVHISDLHFGRTDPTVVSAVIETIHRIRPDLVAVSGDFTQRARDSQFRDARAFLDALPSRQILIPGNHDVPLYNVAARFLAPLAGYKRHITRDLAPAFSDSEVLVIGVNTSRSMTFGGGAIRRGDVDRLVSAFKAHDRLIKIVVAHHPFDTPYGFSRRTRGAVAVETLVREGADVFLTGHLHVTGAGHTAHRYRLGGRSAIVVEAGTATSTRLRNESNAFNVLRVDPSHVRVEHWGWTAARGGFDVDESLSFVRRDDGWADVAK